MAANESHQAPEGLLFQRSCEEGGTSDMAIQVTSAHPPSASGLRRGRQGAVGRATRREVLDCHVVPPRNDIKKTFLVMAIAVAVSAGCASRTGEVSLPPVEPPAAFARAGADEMPERWWTAFADGELDAAVERALESNLDLETAWQRLREARAVVDRTSASLFPTLDAQLGGEINGGGDNGDDEALRLGLASEYEVDLWGRISSSIEAERFRAEARRADYRTAALTIAAEVARTWFQLIVAREQLELLEQQVETNEDLLSLIENRLGIGQIRRVDILRQRQLLEATREQQFAAEAQVEVLEHQLAVLLGRPPQHETGLATGSLPDLPPLPDTGLPSELVRRRPDVQRAYFDLQAASRDLAVAISNRYPRLSLTASVSTEDNEAVDLFDRWTRSLAGNLVAPIFDAGERRAEVDRGDAVEQQRLFEYGQAVLTAFEEVENALVREAKQVKQIGRIEEQVDLAGEASDQLRLEYLNGVSDYLEVLTSVTDEQQLRRDLLSANLRLLEFRIALYRALAGGFETEREL